MLAGILGGLGVCVTSGRPDWHRRWPIFGIAAAAGWAIGGQMSYGHIVGYTCVGQAKTVVYGFAMLWVVGALWAGCGAALLAIVLRARWKQIGDAALLGAALVLGFIGLEHVLPLYYTGQELDFYDSDWLQAITTLAVAGGLLLPGRLRMIPLFLAAAGMMGCALWLVEHESRALSVVLAMSMVAAGLYWTRWKERGGIREIQIGTAIATAIAWGLCCRSSISVFVWALAAVLAWWSWALVSHRAAWGARLAAALAAGWWIGILVLVRYLDLHMTPPRSDNWAGVLGIFAVLLVLLAKERKWSQLLMAATVAAWGGAGLAIGDLANVLGRASGWDLDCGKWMEQGLGLFMGVGLALAMSRYERVVPMADDAEEDERPAWVFPVLLALLFFGMPWLSYQQNVSKLVEHGIVPRWLYGYSPMSYAAWATALAAAAIFLMARRQSPPGGRPGAPGLAWIPSSALGQAQLSLIVLVWLFTIGNLEKQMLSFVEHRLWVEGVFHLCALGITVLVACYAPTIPLTFKPDRGPSSGAVMKRSMVLLCYGALIVLATSLGSMLLYEGKLPGSHYRFDVPTETDSPDRATAHDGSTILAPPQASRYNQATRAQSVQFTAWFSGVSACEEG